MFTFFIHLYKILRTPLSLTVGVCVYVCVCLSVCLPGSCLPTRLKYHKAILCLCASEAHGQGHDVLRLSVCASPDFVNAIYHNPLEGISSNFVSMSTWTHGLPLLTLVVDGQRSK